MNAQQTRSVCARIDLSSFRTMRLDQLADLADSLMARDVAGLADVTKSELVAFLVQTQADLIRAGVPSGLVAARFR